MEWKKFKDWSRLEGTKEVVYKNFLKSVGNTVLSLVDTIKYYTNYRKFGDPSSKKKAVVSGLITVLSGALAYLTWKDLKKIQKIEKILYQ